ncbi:acyltransferase family protein [Candidatus Poribacteria bacterium]|nr:acyltransferase family protein [Candidatus Poribacteria bacterium]
MPRKVLGKDPFERSKSSAPKEGTEAADARAADAGGIKKQEATKKAPARAPKRIKLLEPSQKPAAVGATEQIIEKKIEKRISEFENRLGKLLEETEDMSKQANPSKRTRKTAKEKAEAKEKVKVKVRKQSEDKKETEEDASSSSAESESTTSSEESVSSDSEDNSVSEEDDGAGLFRQLIGMASPRKMGKLFGSLWLRTHSDDVDEFGKDPLYVERFEPLFEWLYRNYWRVEVEGIENIPDKGRALLVANHSGMLPFDGIMINEAVKSESRTEREVRFLAEDMFSTLPFLSPFLTRIGAVRACQENAERLLGEDHLVCVFPEGVKGTGKTFSERYKLQRFGRGGFIKLCMKMKTPLVPVAVIGAEEIYPIMAKFEWIGKPFGLPYVPVTPSWPLLGPLGLIPLPSKWRIRFGKPVRFDKYGREAAQNDVLVNKLKEDVRSKIQNMVDDLVKKRRSVWFG